MGKAAVGVLIILVLLIAGIYYIAGPSTVLSESIEVAGLGAVSESFQLSGFRNQIYIKIIIEGKGTVNALNITIQDPNGANIYSLQDSYGKKTYLINATVGISITGKYKIIFVFIGDLSINISIKSYHSLFSFMVPKE